MRKIVRDLRGILIVLVIEILIERTEMKEMNGIMKNIIRMEYVLRVGIAREEAI